MRGGEIILRGVGVVAKHGPILRRLIQHIDDETVELGPSAGIRVIFDKFKASASASWDGNIAETQLIFSDSTKPVILISNHPNFMEPFMFLSLLPPRRNLSLVGMAGVEQVFEEEMKRHFIPVYHRGMFETSRRRKQRQGKNTMQIDEAGRRLQQGEAVLIIPDGGDGTGRWKNGVVKLIETGANLSEAYIIMAHIPKSRKGDLWRLLFRRGLRLNVRISEAIPIKDLLNHIESMPIQQDDRRGYLSQALQRFYENWVNSDV